MNASAIRPGESSKYTIRMWIVISSAVVTSCATIVGHALLMWAPLSQARPTGLAVAGGVALAIAGASATFWSVAANARHVLSKR